MSSTKWVSTWEQECRVPSTPAWTWTCVGAGHCAWVLVPEEEKGCLRGWNLNLDTQRKGCPVEGGCDGCLFDQRSPRSSKENMLSLVCKCSRDLQSRVVHWVDCVTLELDVSLGCLHCRGFVLSDLVRGVSVQPHQRKEAPASRAREQQHPRARALRRGSGELHFSFHTFTQRSHVPCRSVII